MWAYKQSFFSRKLGELGEGWGGGDYGQLRYTHSVSPYRSIATGGSHFLVNGCFHRSRQRSVFPFNSIISSLPRRFFPFFFRPISLSLLLREISSLINLMINLWNFAFLELEVRSEEKEKRETVEKFLFAETNVWMLLLVDSKKDGSRFWAYSLDRVSDRLEYEYLLILVIHHFIILSIILTKYLK